MTSPIEPTDAPRSPIAAEPREPNETLETINRVGRIFAAEPGLNDSAPGAQTLAGINLRGLRTRRALAPALFALTNSDGRALKAARRRAPDLNRHS